MLVLLLLSNDMELELGADSVVETIHIEVELLVNLLSLTCLGYGNVV